MRLRQRLCTALAIATLAFAGFSAPTPSPVSAAVRQYEPAAAPALQYTSVCEDNVQHNYWAGGRYDPASRVTAAAAYMYTQLGFLPCSYPDAGNDGSSAWVALTPGAGNSHYNDGNAIFQVGIEYCTSPAWGYACDSNGPPRYFFSNGGCNLNYPTPQDLGPATYGEHRYAIKTFTNTTTGTLELGMWIDSVYKGGVLYSAPAVNCWVSGDLQAQYYGERHDTGDSFGDDNCPDYPGCQPQLHLRLYHLYYQTSTPNSVGPWLRPFPTYNVSLPSTQAGDRGDKMTTGYSSTDETYIDVWTNGTLGDGGGGGGF